MSSNYEIRERLKKYQEFQQEMCDECGYEGTFGVTRPRVSALFRVPISAAMLFGAGVLWQYVLGENPVAWFFLFPPIVAFYIYFLNRKDIVCPNCGARRRRTETFVVAYDANKYDRIEYGAQAQGNTDRILAYMEAFDKTGKRDNLA
ncbi:MAG TPA: hypothetical protein VN369_05290 [Terriglobales bacterium]|nr:hypothetical protein [Candidatus Acidoferrum sp.]HWQ51202.1 hypothetical protein [Terriglobales bacterium]